MCWSIFVLSGVLIVARPYKVQAQGLEDAVAIVEATGKMAEFMPLDITRLALQVAIVSILINLILIFAFWKAQMADASKPCLMSGKIGEDVISNWCYRAFKKGVEKAEEEMKR
jgi:hypothetical protein